MSIVHFVKKLLPSFGKNQVLDDIDSTIAELKEFTIPAYAGALDSMLFTDKYAPKSAWFIEKNKLFRKSGIRTSAALIPYIQAVLVTIPGKLTFIRQQIQKEAGTTIASDGITYQMANLIQIVSYAGFVSRYARRFLLQTYCEEIPTFLSRGDGTVLENPLSPIEIAKINELFAGFLELVDFFSTPEARLASDLGKIPDYLVDINDEDLSMVYSQQSDKVDIAGLGFIPYRYNPIYHVRIAWADYQHSRYLAAKEERQALELRLLAMKQARDSGTAVDATTAKVIEATDKRLRNLNYKIGKMEQL